MKHQTMAGSNIVTHAGCVAYRSKGAGKEYLVISAKNNASDKVLPKGHIEKNETAAEAATRELLEETGLKGVIERPLYDSRPFTVKNEHIIVRYFLVKVDDPVPQVADEDRELQWLDLDDAIARLTFPETKEILERYKKEPDHSSLSRGQ